MAVKCGRGPHKHENVADVARCYNGEQVTELPLEDPTDTVVANEPRATDKQVNFVCSLADQKLPADEARAVKLDAVNGRWGKRSISEQIAKLKAITSRPDGYGPVAAERAENPTESDAAAQTLADLEAGMYRLGDEIYKVQRNVVQGDGSKAYAKCLTAQDECRECDGAEVYHNSDTGYSSLPHKFSPKWKFEYVQGAIHRIRPEMRMSLDEAKAFGKVYGTCCVCGRTLTNETSIEEGIGPICGGRV
jgi:hypothetical protein